MSEGLEFALRNLPNFLIGFPGNRPGGLLMSLILTVVGIGAGFAAAVPLAAALTSRRVVRVPARAVVRVMSGVPLILLLLVVHQFLGGARLLGLSTTLTSAFVTLALYSGAYQGDIIAAGFRSVPPGVVEDARLLGSSRRQVFWLVRLPYAVRVMQPALAGQAITLFKDSSVVIVLGVADLTTTARIALGSDVANAPFWVATYLTVGAIYFVVAFTMSRIARRRELTRRYASLGVLAQHG